MKQLGHVDLSDLDTKRQANAVSLLFRSIEAHCMRVYSFELSVTCRLLKHKHCARLFSLFAELRSRLRLRSPLFDKVIASGSASQQFSRPSQQDRNLRRTTYTSKTTAVRSRQTHHTHFKPAARFCNTIKYKMGMNFMVPLRAAQLLFALLALGLNAYGTSQCASLSPHYTSSLTLPSGLMVQH